MLIGDSVHDANGAQQAGIPFVGVSYGWGFDSTDQVRAGYHTSAAGSVSELKQVLDLMIAQETIK